MEKIFVLPIFTSLECTASFIFGKENSNYFSADFTIDSNVSKLRFKVVWCTKITFLRLDIIYWWFFLIIHQNDWGMNEGGKRASFVIPFKGVEMCIAMFNSWLIEEKTLTLVTTPNSSDRLLCPPDLALIIS